MKLATNGPQNWVKWWPVIALLSAAPLLLPTTPPLVDVPGHIGRFHIELGLQTSESLQQFYSFHWHLIGNLGVDLLVIPLAQLVGLELAVKIIVLCIPVITTAGLFWVAREVHGDVPPSVLFAIPFAYGYPFNFGFVNFALSMGLAFLGWGLWLRLGRQSRARTRAILFVPTSCALWLVHVFGWATLCLLAWSSELIRRKDAGETWLWAGLLAALDCLPLGLPFLLMLLWRAGPVAGMTGGYFQMKFKTFSLLAALRDRWLIWDSFSAGAAVVLIGSAVFDRHLEISRSLGIPAIVLAVIFLLLPKEVFGSAYADMRIAPYMLMLAITALRFRPDSSPEARFALTALCAGFLLVRLAGNALSFGLADYEMKERLHALDHIPAGVRVLSVVGASDNCGLEWALPRHEHVGSFVIARKDGFSNDQWQLPGAQLLQVTYEKAQPFVSDPSELTFGLDCQRRNLITLPKHMQIGRTADQLLQQFPRDAFDFVWLVKPEGFSGRAPPELTPVWRGRDSALYAVRRTPLG